MHSDAAAQNAGAAKADELDPEAVNAALAAAAHGAAAAQARSRGLRQGLHYGR